ncbi:MAG TPA: ATPase, T2SS/T4P/T4SS family, partial [Stenomitos sp.]
MVNSSSSRRALITRQSFSPFGNKLIRTGYIDQEQMLQASMESRQSGKSLVEVVQGLTGKPLPPDLLRQYKQQQLFELKIIYGIDSLDPEVNQIPTDQVGELIERYIPLEICRNYELIPISLNQDVDPPTLLVAMVNPDNLEALDRLNRILRPEGLVLRRMVIAAEDYQHLIQQYLDENAERQEQAHQAQLNIDLAEDLDNIVGFEELAADEGDTDLGAALQDAETAPIIALVNKILAKALQEGVSDIHIEPQEEHLRVRFRKDGVLAQAFPPLPRKIVPAVVSRFKIIAELDIAERRQPQDGRIRRLFQGRKVD